MCFAVLFGIAYVIVDGEPKNSQSQPARTVATKPDRKLETRMRYLPPNAEIVEKQDDYNWWILKVQGKLFLANFIQGTGHTPDHWALYRID